MTTRFRASILQAVQDDEGFYQELLSQGLLPADEAALAPEHTELARVSYTLVHKLEVNWAGVEIVLRMRRELIDTRRQVAELLELLKQHRPQGGR